MKFFDKIKSLFSVEVDINKNIEGSSNSVKGKNNNQINSSGNIDAIININNLVTLGEIKEGNLPSNINQSLRELLIEVNRKELGTQSLEEKVGFIEDVSKSDIQMTIKEKIIEHSINSLKDDEVWKEELIRDIFVKKKSGVITVEWRDIKTFMDSISYLTYGEFISILIPFLSFCFISQIMMNGRLLSKRKIETNHPALNKYRLICQIPHQEKYLIPTIESRRVLDKANLFLSETSTYTYFDEDLNEDLFSRYQKGEILNFILILQNTSEFGIKIKEPYEQLKKEGLFKSK